MVQIILLHRKFICLIQGTQTFSKIRCYSVASLADAAFIIGGYDDNDQIVAQFKNDQWSKFADMNTARGHHGSITFREQTMIIGGLHSS